MGAIGEIALTTVLRRDRLIVISALILLVALAWSYTLWLAASMDMTSNMAMPASEHGTSMLLPAIKPWTLADFVFMFVMWTVMMVGMMTPSAAPMILIYAQVSRQAEKNRRPFTATSFFVSGYLLAWAAFSLAATLGQWLLERVALLTPMMTAASNLLGAFVLIAAGVFQWTLAKDACLKHCQTPLSFILQYGFHPNARGSMILGFRHGLFCVGCCWALMALLFVGGVMNIVWIAGLTFFVLLEKVVPLGRVISRVSGVGLLAWGGWLLFSTVT